MSDIVDQRLLVVMPWIVRVGLVVIAAAASATAQVTLSGRVVDENEAPVANAHVRVHKGEQAPAEAFTGPAGAFRIPLPEAGEYLVSVESPGYFRLNDRPAQVE